MPKITKIEPQKNPDRRSIFVDGSFCVGCHKNKITNLNLNVGDEVDIDDLKQKLSYAWKDTYKDKWPISEQRQDAIISLVSSWGFELEKVGFGSDTNEYIANHPKEMGTPDLEIKKKLVLLESTGCPSLRGDGLWIRGDKVKHALDNPEKDIWFAHRIDKTNEIRFIKLNYKKQYKPENVSTGYSNESMVVFSINDDEVKSREFFEDYLKNKII